METIRLSCKECKYEETVGEGTTKSQFYKDGLWGKVFFCKKTGKFVHLRVIQSQEIFDKSKDVPKDFVPARETTALVTAGSKSHFYTHSSCPDQLIPLQFYKDQENPSCPVCSGGVLKIETMMFSD